MKDTRAGHTDIHGVPAVEKIIEDSSRRKIGLKNPGPLAQYRLVECVGPELSSNQVYMKMTLPLLWISSIDGTPIATPKTKAELEALIVRLGDDGVLPVLRAVEGMTVNNA